ncbi:glycosyltransferase family 2 protein, partial [Escherichia coli]|nr:glycosyltransferase family 2 protein [Escherichia coli]
MLVNEKDECIGYSPLFCKKPSFRNALIQSIAGGNTMLFNQAARNIINLTPQDFKIVSHDW